MALNPTNGGYGAKLAITDEELRKLYWDDGISGKEIAKMYGCSPATVSLRMKKANIKTRHASSYEPTEKQRIAWKITGMKLGGRPMPDDVKAKIKKANKAKRAARGWEFGGHEKLRDDGYIKVYIPEHPRATKDGYVMKHHLVMERHIGTMIPDGYVVHHINHNRTDNRIENLVLMTFQEHSGLHMKERHERKRTNAKCN